MTHQSPRRLVLLISESSSQSLDLLRTLRAKEDVQILVLPVAELFEDDAIPVAKVIVLDDAGARGATLVEQARASLSLRSLPLVFLSDTPDRLDAFDFGADDVQSRSLSERELLARVGAQMQREGMRQSLLHSCTTDELTEVLNRRGLLSALEREQNRASRSHQSFSVLMIDVNDFKEVNDSSGHDVGDMVLRDLAHQLVEQVRSCDQVGRFGGDEFMIVLPDTRHAHAASLASRLQRTVFAGRVTVSVGEATLRPEELWQELLKRADRDLYVRKRAET